MHDHRSGYRGRGSGQQRREALLDPRDRALVRFLGAGKIVEDADRRYRVVGRIHHVVGHKTFDIADNRDSAFLDPACQLFGHAGPGLTLTNGGVHGKSSSSRTPAPNLTPFRATRLLLRRGLFPARSASPAAAAAPRSPCMAPPPRPWLRRCRAANAVSRFAGRLI